jgi:hypothetical protein
MTNDEREVPSDGPEIGKAGKSVFIASQEFVICHSSFFPHSAIRHWAFFGLRFGIVIAQCLYYAQVSVPTA